MTSVSLRVQNEDVYSHSQRRQSGFKFGGCGSGSNKFRSLQTNFREISIFFRQLHKRISQKIRFFQGNFRKMSIFSGNLKQKLIFQAKISHLQLLLGKLFYFSSKVTTFEHTSCT